MMKTQKRHWIRFTILLGCGLAAMLLWGALTFFMDTQPTDQTPAYLVSGAVGKFLFFPLAIGSFSYIFWAALFRGLKNSNSCLTKKTRIRLAVAGLMIPAVYLAFLPGIFVNSPLHEFYMVVFPFLDRYLYTPVAVLLIALFMLPLALAFDVKQ